MVFDSNFVIALTTKILLNLEKVHLSVIYYHQNYTFSLS